MEITSIIPAMRIIKENNMSECDSYISLGDNIRVTDIEGRIFTGIFLYMDLAKSEEEYDSVTLNIGNESVTIQCANIKDIEEV